MKRKLSSERLYQEFIRDRWLERNGYRHNAGKLIQELTHHGYGHVTPTGIHFRVEPQPAELNHMLRDYGFLTPEVFMHKYRGVFPRWKQLRMTLLLAVIYFTATALVLKYSGAWGWIRAACHALRALI